MATPSCSKLMSAATPSQLRVRLEVGGCGSSRSTPRQLHRQLSRAALRSPRRQSDAATLSAHSGFRININPCRLDYHRDSASVHLLLMIEVHAVFCRVRLTFKEWPLVARSGRPVGRGRPTRCHSPSLAFNSYACHSLAAVLREVEKEESFEVSWPFQHLGVMQGASYVVVSCAPMLFHTCSREFVILRVPFVMPRIVNQMDATTSLRSCVAIW